jgi:hypothetical protein
MNRDLDQNKKNDWPSETDVSLSSPMKKTSSKLKLNKSTVRVLDDRDLAAVAGAAPTNQPMNCSGSDHCPPHHTRHCC